MDTLKAFLTSVPFLACILLIFVLNSMSMFQKEISMTKIQFDTSCIPNVHNIALTCWSEPCRGVFGGPGSAILEDFGYIVTSINVREIKKQELIERLKDQDVVLWWNWDTPNIQPDALAEIRNSLPKDQTWCLFNWDDPHAWGRNAPENRNLRISELAEHLYLVYTTRLGKTIMAKKINGHFLSAIMDCLGLQ
jgi:hypothetical protein